MGEAKRKAGDLKAFLSQLTPDERIAYDLIQRVLERLVKPLGLRGACYRMSVLLNRILAREYGVASDVVLGWIDDGDDVFISHAWLEMGGRKIDLMAERPMLEISNRGPTIILDHVFPGFSNVTYAYHLEKTAAALAADLAMVAADPGHGRNLRIKDDEHAFIAAAISSAEAMDGFLDHCARLNGDGLIYERAVALIS